MFNTMGGGSNMLCAADPRHGKFETAACMFRGKGISMQEVES